MAGCMSTRPPDWEKSGNVTWVACRPEKHWFPVAAELIGLGSVELVCPHCGAQLVSYQAYVGGRGYRFFEVCSGDRAHYCTPA